MNVRHRPRIIGFANKKGGVGKTTEATNLTHGLILRGYKTLLVDGDPQGSSSDWHTANDAKLVPCVRLDRETISVDIKAISSGYDVIVIDGAPQASKLSAAVIRASDVILIPVQPSPYDVWATADLVDLIKQRQEITDGLPEAAFIISRMIKNTTLSKEVIAPLSEYGLPILEAKTSQMVAYATSASKGESVFCNGYPVARTEFGILVDEIIKKYIDPYLTKLLKVEENEEYKEVDISI